MEVKIIRSAKRRKTVSARLIKDLIVVNVPYQIPEPQLEKIIARFKEKFQRRKLKEELNKTEDLLSVFKRFNAKYFENGLKVKSIEYVTNQNSKFGCCDYKAANIRISHRLSAMPLWVRDYVIVHEMAHLLEPNHSRAFWALVSRYELAERARGYLMAAGFHQGEDDFCETPSAIPPEKLQPWD